MTPEAALEKQIERYRQMTGEERLKIALDLHQFSCDVAREGIRRQFPSADEAEVERRLRQRLEVARRGEPNGNCLSIACRGSISWVFRTCLSARWPATTGVFNAIDEQSALKVDFWLRKDDAFERRAFDRRQQVSLFGTPAWIATAEDVILHKLYWHAISPSYRQLQDAAGVFAVQRAALDTSISTTGPRS